jgi:hypothetical protein
VITHDIERLSWVKHAYGQLPADAGTVASGEPRGKDQSRVSAEARKLFSDLEADPQERIRARIRNGFYLRPDVVKSTVDSLTPDVLRGNPVR